MSGQKRNIHIWLPTISLAADLSGANRRVESEIADISWLHKRSGAVCGSEQLQRGLVPGVGHLRRRVERREVVGHRGQGPRPARQVVTDVLKHIFVGPRFSRRKLGSANRKTEMRTWKFDMIHGCWCSSRFLGPKRMGSFIQ